ncbi:unnamed protein product [Rotaria sp. Silwood1]|nr:unnamed protein product [Rotaria sp. Silwood1]
MAHPAGFDPIFNRSLSKLIANPTTDTQQMYYNQIISTFGTHYISSIVIGGVVEMFTQVNSKYQEHYDKQSIEKQMSIGFGSILSQMSVSHNFNFEVDNTTEEFKKNTEIEVKFSPSVMTTPTTKHKQWHIWLDRASSTPVVINRTLSPLTDLFIEYPIEIRRHLNLTIDYYLRNGKLPTIDQLSSVDLRKKRSINVAQRLLPHLQYTEPRRRRKRFVNSNLFLLNLKNA